MRTTIILIIFTSFYLLISSCKSIKIPEGSISNLEFIGYLPKVKKANIHKLAMEVDYPFLLSIQNSIFLVPENCIPERALNGMWQGRSLAGGNNGRNAGGGADGRNLDGSDGGRNAGGGADGRNLDGGDGGRNSGGGADGRNLDGGDGGRNAGGGADGRNLDGGDGGRNAGGGADGRNLNGEFADCKCMYYKGKKAIDILGINTKAKMYFYNGSKLKKIKKNRISTKLF